MLNYKKIAILSFTILFLYFALTTGVILPEIKISSFYASLIVMFVAFNILAIFIIVFYEKKKLERNIFNHYSQMRTIIESAPFMIYLKDLDGKILLTNKRFADSINIKNDVLIGKDSYKLYKDPECYIKEDKKIIQDKKCIYAERIVETINSNLGWCKIVKAPVFDERNKINSIVVIFHNIDAEKELEDKKNTFFATLTHDLKTPTIAQIKAIDLMLKHSFGPLNKEQEDILIQIKNSCNYMYNLIFTVLDSYSYDNGQTKIQYSNFNIKELINETVSEIEDLLKEKNQNIILKSNLTTDEIVADRFQIKRVLINFISNAIKYGFKNSDIEVLLDEDCKNIKVCIKNQANTIPEIQIKNIYEKFQIGSDNQSRKTGTGLGLYLSKQIITAHKGRVYAQSSDGVCTFGFSIPKSINKSEVNIE